MELLLLLPPAKPPFIGIVFNNDLTSASLNQTWVNSHKERLYELDIEPSGEDLKITLQMYDIACRCVYEPVKYDAFELNRFMGATRDIHLYSFGHLTRWERGLILTKTAAQNARWVLKVERLRYWRNSPLVLVR